MPNITAPALTFPSRAFPAQQAGAPTGVVGELNLSLVVLERQTQISIFLLETTNPIPFLPEGFECTSLLFCGVNPDDDLAGKGAAGVRQETRALNRGGTDDDVGQAVVQIALYGIEITDTATQLNRDLATTGFNNGFNRTFIHWLTSKSTV